MNMGVSGLSGPWVGSHICAGWGIVAQTAAVAKLLPKEKDGTSTVGQKPQPVSPHQRAGENNMNQDT